MRGARAGAQIVVLLSHNGMDVDLKLATRVTGIDAILGGHTHDGVPAAIEMPNSGGKTLVTNAGRTGSFSACSISTSRRGASMATVIGCCRCSRICCRPIRK